MVETVVDGSTVQGLACVIGVCALGRVARGRGRLGVDRFVVGSLGTPHHLCPVEVSL